MKTFYVATSIPYVNDVPHIGHAMEFIIGDVISRYHRQRGEVFFSTGTDEHGGKVSEKAKEKGMEPQAYADQISKAFADLGKLLNIEYSKFIRTTSEEHESRVAKIWKLLEKDIYKGTYSGMYDQKEETFLTHEEAKRLEQEDPDRHARLEEVEEENYFFKLSQYTEKIKQAISSGELKIVPETRQNEILALLESGLEDISVSRPKEKIGWGIPVPGDDNQTIYVWAEALMNYITGIGFPDQQYANFWPCDVHVIGKDILRFHAAVWPAFLLSLGLELPKSIYVHGFITIDGKVMSKSVGNVVAPKDIVASYGADATRYYLTRHIPSYSDGDFSWAKFERAYNHELGNELGNLVQRVSSMISKYQNGVIGDLPDTSHDEGPYEDAMAEFRLDKALDHIWNFIKGQNQYIEEAKPWEIAGQGDEEHLQEVLALSVVNLMQIAKLLWPFMPATSEQIKSVFSKGIVEEQQGTLFPKIEQYSGKS